MMPDMPATKSQPLLNWQLIKPRREALGLTQEKAAELADFGTRQRWNAIESGRKPDINLDTLRRLAKTLDLPPAALLTKAPKAAKRKRQLAHA